MKLLHITPNFENTQSGFSTVTRLHYEILHELIGKKNYKMISIRKPNKNIFSIFEIILGRTPPMTRKVENDIIIEIIENKFDIAFIESTRFGYLAKKIRKKTDCKVIVFCHDIDKQRFKSLKKSILKNKEYKEWMKISILSQASKGNEPNSIRWANKIIVFNSRDQELLKNFYGYSSDVIPVFIKDQLPQGIEFSKISQGKPINLLFVGNGTYYPNVYGMSFFISKVMPHIDAKLTIVGHGSEALRDRFKNLDPRVEIVGGVESLTTYYLNADAVIEPIFSGGGMKVKTIEALMYGKTIFGTDEAFIGIEERINNVGILCNTADEFIRAINNYNGGKYNDSSRQLYLDFFTKSAGMQMLNKVISDIY